MRAIETHGLKNYLSLRYIILSRGFLKKKIPCIQNYGSDYLTVMFFSLTPRNQTMKEVFFFFKSKFIYLFLATP